MKVENVIKTCQDEVKTNLIDDLLFAGELKINCYASSLCNAFLCPSRTRKSV